jgi:hypothetical protein
LKKQTLHNAWSASRFTVIDPKLLCCHRPKIAPAVGQFLGDANTRSSIQPIEQEKCAVGRRSERRPERLADCFTDDCGDHGWNIARRADGGLMSPNVNPATIC